jgi:hypothetical protein
MMSLLSIVVVMKIYFVQGICVSVDLHLHGLAAINTPVGYIGCIAPLRIDHERKGTCWSTDEESKLDLP